MCDHVQDYCIFMQATNFNCSNISLTRAITCAARAIPTLLLRRTSTVSVVEMERNSPCDSDLGWSSQDQHVQYYDRSSCTRSLHLYPSHYVQLFKHDEVAWDLVSISRTRATTCAACAILTLLLRRTSTVSGVMERHSLRISDLAWSSQDQLGQYHNGWSCIGSLHLYPRYQFK